jgi:hypothetical protein
MEKYRISFLMDSGQVRNFYIRTDNIKHYNVYLTADLKDKKIRSLDNEEDGSSLVIDMGKVECYSIIKVV